jgi:acyl-CoA synthetase (AMP-forming)/AMP-acid ligase II
MKLTQILILVQPALLTQTIPEHFASIVSQHGDRPAVICRSPTRIGSRESRETSFTYSGLDTASSSLAIALRALGVKKGDRVAVSLGNCPEFAVLTYAIFKLGAILVPLNPAFTAQQVGKALDHLGVELLIIGAVTDLAYKPGRGRSSLPLLQALVPDLTASHGRENLEAPGVKSLRKIVIVDNTASHSNVAPYIESHPALVPYSELLAAHQITPSQGTSIKPSSPLNPSDTINIQFTSGTTAQPKAAMLSHTSILNNGHLIARRMGLTPADKIVCPPPLFHCFGSVLGYMATATTGASILFPSPAFDPLASLKMVQDHRATGLYGVATMFVAMLDILSNLPAYPDLDPTKVPAFPEHLRKGIAAGSSVPEALMRKLYAALGLEELVICYGMTETSPVSCMTTPHDSLAARTQTIGRPMAHTAVKIVDPADRSRILPRGEKGELAAAGYCVMKGYWGDEERTREVRVVESETFVGENGEERVRERVWMYSGDEASMDGEGYVSITGRIKDLIIRGGENIHPLEIENCLFQHPLIAEVSVVGVPDERLGECVGAFVVVKKGVQAVDIDQKEVEDAVNSAGDKKLPDASAATGLHPAGASAKDAGETLSRQEVREWVRSHMSGHLVPKYVFWIDEYPKTASGKIQKFKLRELARHITAREQ